MNPVLAVTGTAGFVSALLLPSTGAKLFGLWIGFGSLLWIWMLDTSIKERYPGEFDPDRRTHP